MKKNPIWSLVMVLLLVIVPIIARANRIVGWGTNASGQLTIPINLRDVTQITSAADSSAALRKDGTVVVWGETWEGQSSVPTNLTNVVQIAGGWHHYLALKSDGSIVGWGWNGGADGFGTAPVGIASAKAVAAGFNTSFAVLEDGTVYAWGASDFGQRNVPTNLSNVVQIAAGRGHALALKADGTVVAWGAVGHLNFGQAVVPNGLEDVVQIAAGDFHSLALKRDGTVVAWGANWASQATVPADLGKIARISAKGANSLALSDDNKLTVWGGLASVVAPSELATLGIVDFCAGEDHAIALLSLFDSDSDGVNDYREGKDRTNPNDATSFNPLSVGLVAYYPFDGNANDESGYGFNGTLPNGALATTDRFFEKDAAYYFNGIDQYVEYPKFGLTDARTFSGWVKFPEATNAWTGVPLTGRPELTMLGQMPSQEFSLERWHFHLIGQSETLGDPRSLSILYHSLGFPDDNQPYGVYSSTRNNGWHHYVVVINPISTDFLKATIYINGTEVGKVSSRVPQELDSPYQSMRLNGGSSVSDIYYTRGSLDNLRVYNRALSSEEVASLYYSEAFNEEQRLFTANNPRVIGHYSQADYDLNRTNGQVDVTANPAAFNLFTQSEYESFGALQFSNGMSSVISNPSAVNLFTQEQFNSNRTAGQSDVINSPMSYGLYTSNSIMDLRMGGLLIQKVGTNAVVSFQPQTTTDLTQPFTNNGTPITNTIPMPGNKGFIRINAKP